MALVNKHFYFTVQDIRVCKAYRFFHRVCKERGVPRSRRGSGWLRIWIINDAEVAKHQSRFYQASDNYYVIITFDWLNKNLTKREFADYTRLRLYKTQ